MTLIQFRSLHSSYGHRVGPVQKQRASIWQPVAIALLLALALPGIANARTLRITCFGDSLSAGYELPNDAAFPSVLQRALRADGFDVDVTNAGVSGDTALDGVARLDWSIADGTDLVVLELGANDMLRGAAPAQTRAALTTMLTRLKARKITVLLAGMQATPDLGQDYKNQFDGIYPALARQFNVALYPFFLEGVAGVPELGLSDGLHPNRAGVELIVKKITPMVEEALKNLPSHDNSAL